MPQTPRKDLQVLTFRKGVDGQWAHRREVGLVNGSREKLGNQQDDHNWAQCPWLGAECDAETLVLSMTLFVLLAISLTLNYIPFQHLK